MPVINVAMHRVNEETKKTLIKELSLRAAEITQVPLDRFTVFIEEFENENIGCGGVTLKEFRAAR